MNMKKVFWAALSLSLVAFIGCGPDPNLGQVSGVVTYRGEPVEGATVTFLPVDGDGVLAVSKTDTNGRYVLVAPVAKKGVSQGAFRGKYNVTIRKLEVIPSEVDRLYEEGKITYQELQDRGGGGGGTSRDLLPIRYRNAPQSGLEAEVKAKTQNEFNFELVD
jgi:hypothetical protein